MPLLDSGEALFAGTAREFMTLAPISRLTAHVSREFNRRWGTATESEIRSWRNSLTAMASVVEQADIDHSGVGVELRLPSTSRRVDVSLIGHDDRGAPHVVLAELKQWETVAASRFPDNVVVGGIEHLHPSAQVAAYAAYLRDSHSAFTEREFALSACCYLHGLRAAGGDVLRADPYASTVAEAAVFSRDDGGALSTWLASRLCGGNGLELLPELVNGRFRPSRKLLEGVQEALRGSPGWVLLDEQRLAFNLVRGLVSQAVTSGSKHVLVVQGGPGTGKSVIAAHLLVAVSAGGRHSVCHATGSKAFTTNLRAISPRGAASVFRYFNNFREQQTDPDSIDVIVCDEAHRLRQTSNDRFTRTDLRSELTQTEEIVRAGRVSVFFLDQRQNVRPDESGTVSEIRAAAASQGAELREVTLSAQFRCGGSAAYIDWVDALMSAEPQPAGAWLQSGEYDFHVHESPAALEAALRDRMSTGAAARIVAGFCWPWSDPGDDGSLVQDVAIGDWHRPWNEKAPEQQRPPRPAPRADRHPYYLWATRLERFEEVGCIYSAQGFEFDYCGVILGDDLLWRDNRWIANKSASEDPAIKRRRHDPDRLAELLQHTYRVLLTRGMKGTFVHSIDPETQAFLARMARL
jgi:uncharacterized protein